MKSALYIIILLIYLLPFSIFAEELTPSQVKEFNNRLELYGLKGDKSNTQLIPLGNPKLKYDPTLILELQKEIQDHYLPKLQTYLGRCEKEDCLERQGNYLSLKTSTETVCMPYTTCEFYHCMEKKYQCKKAGVNYFTDLAYPTCGQYKKNLRNKYFTQQGHDWIYSVMVCLQKGLIDECELTKNCQKDTTKKSCDYITDFTLKFHPGCYLNSGVGVCNLPLLDKINIWRTVAKFLTKDELKQAIETVKRCYLSEQK